MRFDHAGVATNDLDALADLYRDLLGADLVHEEEFDGLRVAFLDFGNSYFELLEPVEHATVARFLDKHGPGVHHLALETDDVAAALETAREMDVDLIDEEPQPGAWGHDVAFLHPRDTGGVLIEFVEH